MSTRTDPQLLADYVEQGSEAAFAELVRRHIDLVYSAALRMTCDPHSAQDVTQLVFVAMAREARKLQKHPVVSAWLHRTARNVAANVVRSDVRRRAREQTAIDMNPPTVMEPDTIWERIAPQLDTAIGELSESDRNALMLRFLEGKSARETGEILGVNAETAQKRVYRAVERLREFFGKRGITINTGSLGLMIASKGVQSAPTGLAAAISSAVAAAGGAATTVTVGIPIAMNWTTAKTAAAIILAGAVTGTGTYLAQRGEISRLRSEVRESAGSEARLKAEREAALASTRAQEAELERFRREQGELIRLRGQVASMRRQLESQASKPVQAPPEPDRPHHSPGSYVAKEELSYAGYATPEAALETISWAMMNGSYEQANEGA